MGIMFQQVLLKPASHCIYACWFGELLKIPGSVCEAYLMDVTCYIACQLRLTYWYCLSQRGHRLVRSTLASTPVRS